MEGRGGILDRLLQPRRAISSEEPPCPRVPSLQGLVVVVGNLAGRGEVTRLVVVHKVVERMKSKTYGELKSYLYTPAVSSSLGGGWEEEDACVI